MDKSCWSCGHWLVGLGCAEKGINKYIHTEHDHVCDKWLPEGTKGTVTDYNIVSDGTSWEGNEFLKDDESNL